jgi:hypothetical protein
MTKVLLKYDRKIPNGKSTTESHSFPPGEILAHLQLLALLASECVHRTHDKNLCMVYGVYAIETMEGSQIPMPSTRPACALNSTFNNPTALRERYTKIKLECTEDTGA